MYDRREALGNCVFPVFRASFSPKKRTILMLFNTNTITNKKESLFFQHASKIVLCKWWFRYLHNNVCASLPIYLPMYKKYASKVSSVWLSVTESRCSANSKCKTLKKWDMKIKTYNLIFLCLLLQGSNRFGNDHYLFGLWAFQCFILDR